RLDVCRRHVLARRVDDDLLLAVDQAEISLLVELADVACVQPAVRVDCLGGLLGQVPVAEHHELRPYEHLTVLGDPDLAPRAWRPDRPDPHGSGPVARARATG